MVAVFGLSKAIANLFTGKLIAEIGRKRTLLLGWAMALQAPMLLLLHSADSALIIAANIDFRFEPRLYLVYYGDHENRYRWTKTPRHSHGLK